MNETEVKLKLQTARYEAEEATRKIEEGAPWQAQAAIERGVGAMTEAAQLAGLRFKIVVERDESDERRQP